MAETSASNLLSQNQNNSEQTSPQSNSINTSESVAGSEAKGDNSHSGHKAAPGAERNIFSNLISENTGDHYEYKFEPLFSLDLPKIVFDNGNFHFYSGLESMEKAGVYKMIEHKGIVRSGDNQAPQIDLSVTSLVFFQWVSMALIVLAFWAAGRSSKKTKGKAPKGFANLMELSVEFIRDEVVYPSIPVRKTANKLLLYF